MHNVPVAEKGNPPGGVVMDAVEVRSLTSSNGIRKKAAAHSVVVNRIEGAAGAPDVRVGQGITIPVEAHIRGLPETTARITSVSMGWTGSGKRRGCSCAKTWATV